MKAPLTPVNEVKRLNALKSLGLLDTSSEERFDRLTRMAKRMFDVPIALVSLVDENRQWFKSCVGLDVSETPRDISFCGHAILGNEIFIINDASKDERFFDNPLVTHSPNIRFYAGCPLRYSDGIMLGTLCIIDTVPRELNDDDLAALKDLAATAERELLAVHMATIDELTNITNRRGFKMIAEHSLNLCVRNDVPASLVYLDLDNFKIINDTYGHAEGDKVLATFAEQLTHLSRDSDIVTRLGGDEFAILQIHTTKSLTEEFISRLKQSLNKYRQDNDHRYDVSFSYGIVEFNKTKHDSISTLLEESDKLMYENKQSKNKR